MRHFGGRENVAAFFGFHFVDDPEGRPGVGSGGQFETVFLVGLGEVEGGLDQGQMVVDVLV